MEINITLMKKMGYYVATAAEAFRAYGIPTRYVEGYYLSGDDIHSEGCYALAIAAAHEFGGVETYNSNDGNSTISFAPTRTFEFDDSSSAQVTYGGVFVIC